MKFTYTKGKFFIKLRFFFSKVFFIINTLVFTFACDAVSLSRKTLCCGVGARHVRFVSARSLRQSGVFGVHPSENQKMEVRGY